jgi:hypothetical protein
VEIETDQSINSGRVAIESVDGVCCLKWYHVCSWIRERNPPQRETTMNNNNKRLNKRSKKRNKEEASYM